MYLVDNLVHIKYFNRIIEFSAGSDFGPDLANFICIRI